MESMTILSTIAIISFIIAAIFLVISIILFFSYEILDAIRTLQNGNPLEQKKTVKPMFNSVPIKISTTHDSSQTSQGQVSTASPIDEVQQTVDSYEDNETNNSGIFPTIDWNLPEGVSFVLTKNIMVCHSDKEYMIREN